MPGVHLNGEAASKATPHVGWSRGEEGGTLRFGQRLLRRTAEPRLEGDLGEEERTAIRAGDD